MNYIKKITQEIREKFVFNWTTQLIKEYQSINYQYNLKLSKPVILIKQMSNKWGEWDSIKKSITIAEELIINHAWENVIGILKHEMCHQIVNEILHSQDVHGKDFKKAAKLIGLQDFYVRPELPVTDLFPNLKEQGNEEQNGVLRKLEKLLALSESSEEHEAMLALERAKELYRKYNIDQFKKDISTPFVQMMIDLHKQKIPSHVFTLTAILQNHFFVNVIFSNTYHPLENMQTKTLALMGLKHNCLMAEYVFTFLDRTVHSLWKSYQKKHSLDAKFKNSYIKGLLEGFQKKLEKTKTQDSPVTSERHDKELIILHDHKLQDFIKTQFPKLECVKSSLSVDKSHFENGKRDGKNINLSKPIVQKSGSIKLLS